jgi:multidrug efflux pump subunit AcrA (membrane-fusion protein)
MKRLSHMVRTYPVRCVLAVVFLAVIVYVVWPKADTVALGNVIANQGDIVEQVRVTGKITPLERVDLGFEKAGTVGHIYVKVGDIVERGALLASLSSQELYAAVKSAEANLLAEQASLAELQKGTRLEEVAVTETELQSATTAAVGAQRDLAVAVRDVYLKKRRRYS